MTELAWSPLSRSWPSFGPLKAFRPKSLNPQRLLSTSQLFLTALLPALYPSSTSSLTLSKQALLLFKHPCFFFFLTSSFTKNVPSSSSPPQLLAQASHFQGSLGLKWGCFSDYDTTPNLRFPRATRPLKPIQIGGRRCALTTKLNWEFFKGAASGERLSLRRQEWLTESAVR